MLQNRLLRGTNECAYQTRRGLQTGMLPESGPRLLVNRGIRVRGRQQAGDGRASGVVR